MWGSEGKGEEERERGAARRVVRMERKTVQENINKRKQVGKGGGD